MLKKFIVSFVVLLYTVLTVNAQSVNSYIKKTDIESNSTVSVMVKNTKTGKIEYRKNAKKLLNPASTLKLLSFGADYYVLGKDYQFETIVYKDINNNLYLKLAGDPLLTSANLRELFAVVKENTDINKINNIYIDDSIFDKKPYPDSWMQEDMWPNQRPITPYIVDNNTTKIAIKRSSLATKIDILQYSDYKLPIINELKLGEEQNYEIVRAYGENSPITNFRGTIKQDEQITLPVLNPQINFVIKLNNALNKNGYSFCKKIQFAKTPLKVTKIASFSHSIEEVSQNILKNSDNFASEVVSKVAAAKFIGRKRPATNEDAINLFKSVYKNIITDEICISDSSGVSRKNLVNLKFMIDAYSYISSLMPINDLMITSNEGTMRNRLLFLTDNIKVKTGTLSNMSSIIGNLNSQKNNNLIFGIIVQNAPYRKAILKNFEDEIVTLIYRNY